MAAGARRAVQALRLKVPSASRSMSGHGSYEQELAEMQKWRKVTYIVAPGSLLVSAYMLLTAKHPEHAEKIVRSPLPPAASRRRSGSRSNRT